MPELVTQPVPLAVSACLDGCPVRYNGKSFDSLAVLGRDRSAFTFTPVCPEVMAGLGVPREPVHLTGAAREVLSGAARVRDRHGSDRTEPLLAGCAACLGALERAGAPAVVLKDSSPSCGVTRTRTRTRGGAQAEGPGVFGAMLLDAGLFVIPDTALASPLKWWDARRRLHAWLWLRRREPASVREMDDTWHVVKFLVQELDRPLADAVGRELAAMHPFDRARAEEVRRRVLDVLRRPSTPERVRRSMWRAYSRLRARARIDGVPVGELCVDAPEVRRNQAAIAEELLALEKVSYMNDLLLGPSPVIARSGPYVSRERRGRKG